MAGRYHDLSVICNVSRVRSQNESAVAAVPLLISLPPAVGAIDFYIDLAIDCVETVNVTVTCQVSVAAWPLPVVVRRNVSSICASAQVGQYFGFYNQAGKAGFWCTNLLLVEAWSSICR